MRNLILKDHSIDKDECLALLDEYAEFIEKHTGVECEFYVEGYDFSRVPTTPDSDGDLKPTYAYRKALTKDVHDRYGDYGVDNIVMMVHEKHFTFAGVWGVNWSYVHHKYSLQLCRWDKDNPANSFGTLYHEQMHSFDAVIKQETGEDIEPQYGGDWDRNVVHGAGTWDYIRYKENTDALVQIGSRLKTAYQKRQDKHEHRVSLLTQTVKLLSTIVSLLKKKHVLD